MNECPEFEKRIISILLENEAGVLSGVAGLFAARGYNIESLTVSKTDDPTLSRMTIVTSGSGAKVEQIISQLNKLVMVVEVRDLSRDEHIEREMTLVKIACNNSDAEELLRVVQEYHANVVQQNDTICLVELMADGTQIDKFLQALSGWKVLEVARSGTISLGLE